MELGVVKLTDGGGGTPLFSGAAGGITNNFFPKCRERADAARGVGAEERRGGGEEGAHQSRRGLTRGGFFFGTFDRQLPRKTSGCVTVFSRWGMLSAFDGCSKR